MAENGGSLAAQQVSARPSSTPESRRAEYGLLVALVVFVAVVGGFVRVVVTNDREADLASEATEKSRAGTESPVEKHPVRSMPAPSGPAPRAQSRPVPPGVAKRMPSVTIVADPRTAVALETLRKNAVDDSKPLKVAKKVPAEEKKDYTAQLDVDGLPIDLEAPEPQAAASILKQYQAAKSWKAKLPLIYEEGQTAPLMEQFYGTLGQGDPDVGTVVAAANLRVGSQTVLLLSCKSSDRMRSMINVAFRRSAGGLKLDWESTVGYSEKSMRQFRESRSVLPCMFRLLAVADDYYNFEFADTAKTHLSVRLYTPSGDDYVNAYCPRDSADGKKLHELLGDAAGTNVPAGTGLRRQKGDEFPVTVQIAFPANAQSTRCVKIEKLVSAWWLSLSAEKQTTAGLQTGESRVSETQ